MAEGAAENNSAKGLDKLTMYLVVLILSTRETSTKLHSCRSGSIRYRVSEGPRAAGGYELVKSRDTLDPGREAV